MFAASGMPAYRTRAPADTVFNRWGRPVLCLVGVGVLAVLYALAWVAILLYLVPRLSLWLFGDAGRLTAALLATGGAADTIQLVFGGLFITAIFSRLNSASSSARLYRLIIKLFSRMAGDVAEFWTKPAPEAAESARHLAESMHMHLLDATLLVHNHFHSQAPRDGFAGLQQRQSPVKQSSIVGSGGDAIPLLSITTTVADLPDPDARLHPTGGDFIDLVVYQMRHVLRGADGLVAMDVLSEEEKAALKQRWGQIEDIVREIDASIAARDIGLLTGLVPIVFGGFLAIYPLLLYPGYGLATLLVFPAYSLLWLTPVVLSWWVGSVFDVTTVWTAEIGVYAWVDGVRHSIGRALSPLSGYDEKKSN